jgi:small subunit ribosomal protein S16
VKIRLQRRGAKKRPFYRILVMDSRRRRDGPFIDQIGTYNPMREPAEITVNKEKALLWLDRGAQTSNTVRKLFTKIGLGAAAGTSAAPPPDDEPADSSAE